MGSAMLFLDQETIPIGYVRFRRFDLLTFFSQYRVNLAFIHTIY